jgi:hypothetical protein
VNGGGCEATFNSNQNTAASDRFWMGSGHHPGLPTQYFQQTADVSYV